MKLDAPTITALGSIALTALGMILAYMHGGRTLAARPPAAPPPPPPAAAAKASARTTTPVSQVYQ